MNQKHKKNSLKWIISGMIMLFLFIFVNYCNAGYEDDFESYEFGTTTDSIFSDSSNATDDGYVDYGYTGQGIKLQSDTINQRYLTNINYVFSEQDTQCIRSKYVNADAEFYFELTEDSNPVFGIEINYNDTSGFNEVSYYGTTTPLLLLNNNVWVDFCINFDQTDDSYNLCYKLPDEENYTCFDDYSSVLSMSSGIEWIEIGQRTTVGAETNRQMYYDDFQTDLNASSTEDNVDIIEINPTINDIYVSSESFLFETEKECLISTSCPITVWYNYADVGKDVYLVISTSTGYGTYIDKITLEDKPFLKDSLSADIKNSEQVVNYKYYLYNSLTSETEEYGYTKIYWVNELDEDSEDLGLLGTVFSKLLNIFPINLILQIFDISSQIKESGSQTSYVNYTLDDIVDNNWLPDDYSSSTASILNKSLLEDNLPIWETHIYPFMEYIIYIMNFLLIVYLLLLKPRVND